jgi:O-antigen ligase
MYLALWHVTSRQWKRHRLRVALTTLGIALGVAVFFAVRTANASLLDSLALTVERLAGKSTLEVTAIPRSHPRNGAFDAGSSDCRARDRSHRAYRI